MMYLIYKETEILYSGTKTQSHTFFSSSNIFSISGSLSILVFFFIFSNFSNTNTKNTNSNTRTKLALKNYVFSKVFDLKIYVL